MPAAVIDHCALHAPSPGAFRIPGVSPLNLKDLVDAGIGALLLTALVGGYRRWWVYGWLFTDMVAERDFWRKMALASTDLAKKATRAPQKRQKGDA